MNSYDIILPRLHKCGMTVKEFYYKHGEGKEKDIKEIERIIRERYPEYVSAMEKVFNSTQASYWNLAVMKKNQFVEYCKWLFDILFELEKRIDLSGYTPAEARIYGYLSEILLNIWVEKEKLKVYRSGIIFVDNNKVKNFLRKLRALYFQKD